MNPLLTEKALVHSPVRVIAVDPGKSGAACLMGQGWFEVRRDYQTLPEIASAIKDLSEVTGGPEIAIIEQVGARPGEGVCSVFAFGKSTGVAIGAFEICFPLLPLHEVHPLKWQNFFRLEFGILRPREFDSREICQKLFPSFLTLFKRKKDHNTADAVLIATWALLHQHELLSPRPEKPPSASRSRAVRAPSGQ